MPYIIEDDWFEDDFIDDSPYLEHYGRSVKDGAPRGSGRYPLGSGEVPYQHEPWFEWGNPDKLYNQVERIKEQWKKEHGKSPTNTQIAHQLGKTRDWFDKHYPVAVDDFKIQRLRFIERCMKPYKNPLKRKEPMSAYEIDKYTREHFGEEGRIPETTVYSAMNEETKARLKALQSTANFLKYQVKEKGMIDIGDGTHYYMPGGISETKFNSAVALLEEQGYKIYIRNIDQQTNPGSQFKTKYRVLCPPGTPKNILYTNLGDVKTIADFHAEIDKNGETKFWKMEYPASMDSKRLKVNFGDEVLPDGTLGKDRDGWMFIRRGVKDLDLGNSLYAQVRILVDGTHYLKGMASYYDGPFPDGIDIMFNTNKPKGTPIMDANPKATQVLKPIEKEDPINPFGATIKVNGQSHYIDKDGTEKLGLINKKEEEGGWDEYSKSLAAQFTSKQDLKLIKQQIDISLNDKKVEFEKIKQLENPVVKKSLLMQFANSCDSDATDLRTAPLPGQSYKVFVPIPTLKDNECYCPQFPSGTQICVVRYPHGGIFEIPVLTVNNKNKEGLQLLGKNTKDCIGLPAAAEHQLSGADNDGDFGMVIPMPTNDKSAPIVTRPPIMALRDFDPELEYPRREAVKDEKGKIIIPASKTLKKGQQTQIQMGSITNLITDIQIRNGGGTMDEVKAVKHSMVIIDAPKHGYDWQKSEEDNDIKALREKYQGHYDLDGNWVKSGPSTLISRAKAPYMIDKREGQPKIDRETGELIYKTARDEKLYYTDKNGKLQKHTQSVPQMSLVKNAYQLMSNPDPAKAHPKEVAYADYANSLKAMANEARKLAAYGLEPYVYSPEAAEKYANEVSSIMQKLHVADMNRPRERESQKMTEVMKTQYMKEHPEIWEMSKTERKKKQKKIAQRLIVENRGYNQSKREKIEITDAEWEAIKNHAIQQTSLEKIIKYAKPGEVQKFATPKENSKALTSAQIRQIEARRNAGYTYAEIAESLGLSTSTVNKYLNGG